MIESRKEGKEGMEERGKVRDEERKGKWEEGINGKRGEKEEGKKGVMDGEKRKTGGMRSMEAAEGKKEDKSEEGDGGSPPPIWRECGR